MTKNFWVTLTALLLAVFLFCATPAVAMQILEAVDNAELEAVISDRAVSRITLAGDRVARVVRGPDGFAVEHDPARGDLYIRPLEPGTQTGKSVTLFIGTAKGFTYRLSLLTDARDSAQILIRNAAAIPRTDGPVAGEPRVGALTALVRAVALREVPPGRRSRAWAARRPLPPRARAPGRTGPPQREPRTGEAACSCSSGSPCPSVFFPYRSSCASAGEVSCTVTMRRPPDGPLASGARHNAAKPGASRDARVSGSSPELGSASYTRAVNFPPRQISSSEKPSRPGVPELSLIHI